MKPIWFTILLLIGAALLGSCASLYTSPMMAEDYEFFIVASQESESSILEFEGGSVEGYFSSDSNDDRVILTVEAPDGTIICSTSERNTGTFQLGSIAEGYYMFTFTNVGTSLAMIDLTIKKETSSGVAFSLLILGLSFTASGIIGTYQYNKSRKY